MFYKKCPFCGNVVRETFAIKKSKFALRCEVCYSKGITVQMEADTLFELQKIWNTRAILSDEENQECVSKTKYGYLIMPNAEIVLCERSHPEMLLEYLGIDTDINSDEYISICHNLGIIRISEHSACIMLDFPVKFNKLQKDKCFTLLENYTTYKNFNIFLDQRQTLQTFFSLKECMLGVDKLKC